VPIPFPASAADQDVVQLRIMDEHVTLTRWTGYDFSSDYMTPASGFHFVVADGDLPSEEREALKCGARVRLTINGAAICDGHIDSIEVGTNRSSGTTWKIAGRSRLGLAVDAIADPTLHIKESLSLAEALKLIYAPFGWLDDDQFSIDNAASRNVTQGLRGTPTTKGGKKKGPRPLKSFVLHQTKPNNREGVHEFAKRMAERHGLTIRCSEDGERLIIDTPNFEQPDSFQIRRGRDGSTNVIDGTVKFDFAQQPACIIADGFSGGGEFGRGRIKAFCVNPYFGTDQQGNILNEVTAVLQKHPLAQQVVITTQPFERRTLNVPPRIVFLHDEESKTQHQLNNFLRREMSLFMRKSMTASYTVEGHGQVVDGAFVPWMVDTVVDVQDELAGVSERMWVQGVDYSKSRGSGTTTRVELVRLYSLQFGDPEPESAAAKPGGNATTRPLSDDEFIRNLHASRGLSGAAPGNGSLAKNVFIRNPGDRVVDMSAIRNLTHPNLKR